MQAGLQERYQDKWQHLSPEIGKDQLLWLMIELGEVADDHQERRQPEDYGRQRYKRTFHRGDGGCYDAL